MSFIAYWCPDCPPEPRPWMTKTEAAAHIETAHLLKGWRAARRLRQMRGVVRGSTG